MVTAAACILTVGALIVAACSGGPRPRGPSRDDWAQARAIAERYLRERHGDTGWTIEAERAGTPFLFKIRTPDAYAILVHAGAVFEQRGLAGLDRFLRESRCVEQRTTTLAELLTLVEWLQALPPGTQRGGHFRKTARADFRPRLDFADGGGATLTLYYSPDRAGRSDRDEGAPENSDLVSVIEWKLAIDPGQMPVWRQRPRQYDTEQQAFVDVDHAK